MLNKTQTYDLFIGYELLTITIVVRETNPRIGQK